MTPRRKKILKNYSAVGKLFKVSPSGLTLNKCCAKNNNKSLDSPCLADRPRSGCPRVALRLLMIDK